MESCTSLLSSYADSSDEEVNDGSRNVEDAASDDRVSVQPPHRDAKAVGEEAKSYDVVEGRTASEQSGAGRSDGAEREGEESAASPGNAPANGHDSSGRGAGGEEGDGQSYDGSKGVLSDSVKLHSGDAMPTAIYEWSAIAKEMREVSRRSFLHPAPPSEHCPDEIAQKFERFRVGVESGKVTPLNRRLRDSKAFHNPCLLEKLVRYCGIDQNGTYFPPNLYDPKRFAAADYYKALVKEQDERAAAREKERQMRSGVIEFTPSSQASSRGSRWDKAEPESALGKRKRDTSTADDTRSKRVKTG